MGAGSLFRFGSDVLRGAQGMLDEVQVIPGACVKWTCLAEGAQYTTPVVNDIGPAPAPEGVRAAYTLSTATSPAPAVTSPAAGAAAAPAVVSAAPHAPS